MENTDGGAAEPLKHVDAAAPSRDKIDGIEQSSWKAHIARGWRILPCHSVNKAGQCTCGRPDCGAAGKHPRTLHGVKDATSDPATVQRWSEMFGHDVNWAVATGAASGVAVVDVDPRNGGDKTVQSLGLPDTLTSLTGGSGYHHFYAVDGPTPSRKLGPGIDFQADGKYVVLPDSRHSSGKPYVWRDASQAVAPCPDGLGAASIVGQKVDPAGPVLEGQRNDYLYARAADLAILGWDPEDVRMTTAGLNRSRCFPPLDDVEVQRTVESALNREALPRPLLDWVHQPSRADERGRLNLVTGADLMTMKPPPWMVRDVLPVGSVFEIFGPSDSFKSFVTLSLLLSVATGKPWLGHKVEQTGPVVYVMAEGGADAGNRLRAWLQDHDGATAEGLFTSVEEGINLLDREHVEQVIAELPAGTVCVVFDTLALHMPGGDENSAKEMGLLLSHLRWIARRSGASVGAVHHTGWDTSRERGSTANRGALDVMMQMENGLLTNVKQKFGPRFDPIRVSMRAVGDSLVPVTDDFEAPVGSRAEQLDVVIVMAVGEAPNGMTRDELVSTLRRNRGEVLAAVRRLVRSGRLIERSTSGAAVLHVAA